MAPANRHEPCRSLVAEAGGPGRSRSFGQVLLFNQFNAGFQQALSRHLVVDAMYYWKYTQRDYDFDVLFNTR